MEEPNFQFYLMLIDFILNLNSHTWIVTTLLDSTALESTIKYCVI